jgi:hypothetical protein
MPNDLTNTLKANLQYLEVAEKSVQGAQQALSIQQQKLAEVQAFANENLRKELLKGGTTGNELQDEVILYRGLNSVEIEKFLAFNKLLQDAEGDELLIRLGWEERIQFGGGRGDGATAPRTGYLLGRLSGDRIRFVGDLDLKEGPHSTNIGFQLPFTRYVKTGFQYDKDKPVKPILGPYTLYQSFVSPLYYPLLAFILREKGANPTGEECGLILKGHSADTIFPDIQPEILPKSLLEMLDGPTEEEKILAENI